MKRYKLIHLNASNFYGGPEKQIVEHLKRLDKAFYDPTVVSYLEGGKDSEILQKAKASGLATHGILMNGPLDFSAMNKLREFLIKNKTDLILSHGYKSTVMGWYLARKLGIKIVAYSRGYTAENRKVAFYEWLERRVLNKVDGIISVSRGQLRKLENFGIVRDNHWVVHNAISLGSVGPVDEDFEKAFRQEHNISEDAILGVAAGRLSPEKGHRFFIEAMPDIVNKHPEFIAVICGDGPLFESLKKQAEKLGVGDHVRFVGFRKDVKHIFSFMDLMVLPSLTEGLPNVVLEAFASKKPVVATEVGGVPEVVTDQENGFLVDSEDPKALANAVNKLANDASLRKQMGQAGFDVVKKSFSFEDQTAKLAEIYSHVCHAGIP